MIEDSLTLSLKMVRKNDRHREIKANNFPFPYPKLNSELVIDRSYQPLTTNLNVEGSKSTLFRFKVKAIFEVLHYRKSKGSF